MATRKSSKTETAAANAAETVPVAIATDATPSSVTPAKASAKPRAKPAAKTAALSPSPSDTAAEAPPPAKAKAEAKTKVDSKAKTEVKAKADSKTKSDAKPKRQRKKNEAVLLPSSSTLKPVAPSAPAKPQPRRRRAKETDAEKLARLRLEAVDLALVEAEKLAAEKAAWPFPLGRRP